MPAPRVHVLLVEDDEDDYVLTCGLLTDDFGERYTIDWAPDYDAGLERLARASCDVALVDHHLGGRTGIELLREAAALGCRTPIIMLTGQSDRETDLEAMRAGAADYLVKGRVTPDVLERSIRYARERHRLLEEIRSLSLVDDLTGLGNRRAFFTLADQRLQLLERRNTLCLLIFVDVDGLKHINDTVGHEAGDHMIQAAAHVLRATFRRTDLVARVGGDEFVVLAHEVTEAELDIVLERLESQIEARNDFVRQNGGIPLSMSAGAVSFRAEASTNLQQIVADADARMLQCKQARHAARDQSTA